MFYEISEVSCFKLIKKFFQLSDYCDENTSMHIHISYAYMCLKENKNKYELTIFTN